MSRLLGVVALCAALSACTSTVSTPRPVPATTRQALPDLDTVDPCSLLGASDFKKPFTRQPERLTTLLSCTWATEDEAVWLSVEQESLEQGKVRVRDGSELTVEGRKAWWGVTTERVKDSQEFSVGIIVIELEVDSVLVLRALRTPPSYSVGMAARERSVKVLQRLAP
ncbi:hypothetical protein ACIA8G_16870 [Lentzea sp. NPDC051213]|uniref:hypothetical protein n=1 Tax=Lentzea sp. NPDC051213 TaxID=3364126 RepID=UPI00379907B8